MAVDGGHLLKVLVAGLNYSPEPTGIAPYTTALCRGLAERGHHVRVLTAMPHYPEWRVQEGYGGWRRNERADGVRVHRLRHYVPQRPSGVRRLLSEVSFGAHLLTTRWGRPDVVVFVSPALFSSGLGMLRAKLQGLPSAVWVQDLYSAGMTETAGTRSSAVLRAIALVESRVLASATGVAVIHDRFAEAVERLGVSQRRLTVIRNWTHLPHHDVRDREQARTHLRWGSDEVIALHSGAMGRKQDLQNVVAAAKLAEQRGSPVRFVLMGNGGERGRLEAAAQGVSAITFVDPLPGDRYQQALDAADVLLVNEHRGLREMAVPSKLTSYFSSGRPVVAATDAESVTASEISASGGGVRVEPGQPAAMLDAVVELGADGERSTELGRNGQRYRDDVLSERGALDAYDEWLRSVVAWI